MTEEEWLARDNPKAMLKSLRGTVSDRKLRFLACAALRLYFPESERLHPLEPARRDTLSLCDDHIYEIVWTAERYADGRATIEDLVEAGRAIRHDEEEYCSVHMAALADPDIWRVLGYLVNGYSFGAGFVAGLICEVFGDSFHPPLFAPRWRSADAVQIAQGIYEDLTFGHLPVLADALEDAGCTDDAILAHLRSPGPHVRGCWALDLILGKQ